VNSITRLCEMSLTAKIDLAQPNTFVLGLAMWSFSAEEPAGPPAGASLTTLKFIVAAL